MTVRAAINANSAWMGKEFGESLARRYFPAEVIETLPRGVRGKNAGKFKTTVEWLKVERGGWVGSAPGEGHVENRVGKIIAARIVLKPWGGGEAEVLATFALDDSRMRDRAMLARAFDH